MDRLHQIIVAVWQDVSRHLEIGESTATAADLLSKHLPLQSLMVRRADPDQRRLRIVSAWPALSQDIGTGVSEISLADWRRVQRWLRQGKPLYSAVAGKKEQ